MAEHVTLKWAEESAKALRALPREISGKNGGPLRAALYAAGTVIREEALRNAPVGDGTPNPGNLRRQIFMGRDRNPASVGAAEHYFISVRSGRRGLFGKGVSGNTRALTGEDAFYWWYVEFGTSKQPAQSFMRRSFDAQASTALEVFRRKLASSLASAAERARRQSGVP